MVLSLPANHRYYLYEMKLFAGNDIISAGFVIDIHSFLIG